MAKMTMAQKKVLIDAYWNTNYEKVIKFVADNDAYDLFSDLGYEDDDLDCMMDSSTKHMAIDIVHLFGYNQGLDALDAFMNEYLDDDEE